jgi:ubiquinone/menaquinone biosynthesis C-methylase UbiE
MQGEEKLASSQQLYDKSAPHWVRNGPACLSDYTGRPAVLALCEPVTGRSVLDLGCGEGYCSRYLRQQGAGEVIGLDLSAGMVAAALAQEQCEPLGIRYVQGDARDLSRFSGQTFDLVLSSFMFNYLDIAGMEACMREVARVLRPGGRLVFAVPHPALPFLHPAETPYYFEVTAAGYFSARDGHFSGCVWRRDGTPLELQLRHKILEDYFQALQAAGFSGLPVVRELHVTPEILAIDPAFFGPAVDMPLHLAMAITR